MSPGPQAPQQALGFGPGRFRSLLTFDLLPGKVADDLRLAAATLLKEVESSDLADKPLKILVAVSLEVLVKHPLYSELSPEFVSLGQYDEQPKALVQVAGETEDDRTYARRLVKRHLGPVAALRGELFGGRHTLSREPFGYRDAFLDEKPAVPTSPVVPGLSWILFQDCLQDVEKFYRLDETAQNDVVGRVRDPKVADPGPPIRDSHIDRARTLNHLDGKRPRLLRRSFSYGSYEQEGLAFVAAGGRPEHFKEALTNFQRDRLKEYVTFRDGGIFVAPPSADWLAPGHTLSIRVGENRPRDEQPFYPENPLMLYEMTPSSLEFFIKVFHKHKDNFDENGALREDLKLLGKGLAKLLYGGRIPQRSLLFQLLEHLFVSDTSIKAEKALQATDRNEGYDQTVAKLAAQREQYERNERTKEGLRQSGGKDEQSLAATPRPEFDDSVASLRARVASVLGQPAGLTGVLSDPALAGQSIGDLVTQVIVEDVETMRPLLAKEKYEMDHIIKLCIKAADEARALNAKAGKYMTFIC
jgi:hypothetical protein